MENAKAHGVTQKEIAAVITHVAFYAGWPKAVSYTHLDVYKRQEVVTRMLRYFQNEGMVRLTRGTVEVTDKIRLEQLQND